MANRVRQHTRRTASGKTTRVQQHSRTGRPRKPLVSPGHAWGLLKRARRAGRRKKTGLAVTLGVLALTEVVAWLALDGMSFLLVTLGVVMMGAGALAAAATGRE